MYKIGFACKFVSNKKQVQSRINQKSTTLTYLKKLSEKEKHEKIKEIVTYNTRSLKRMINVLSSFDERLRMLRITSDFLPFYTHKDIQFLYNSREIDEKLNELKDVGYLARLYKIRLSFHPGQYCVLNSVKSNVVENSINELEYHTMLFRKMGYDLTKFHPHNILMNIHVGSCQDGVKESIKRFKKNFSYLSVYSKNILTVENDEYSFSTKDVLRLGDTVPVVFDIHHEWCHTGEYLSIDDKKIKDVISTWKSNGISVRPKMHYSLPPKNTVNWFLSGYDTNNNNFLEKIPDNLEEKPEFAYNDYIDRDKLLNRVTLRDLRKHSNLMWNNKTNLHVSSFLRKMDVMVEAKLKNKASKMLLENIQKNRGENVSRIQ